MMMVLRSLPGLKVFTTMERNKPPIVEKPKPIEVPSLQETNLGKRKVVVCQLGTFKVEDSYGRSQGFIQPPLPFYPVLFFFPHHHNIEVVENIDTAQEYINMMKKYYKMKSVALLGIKN